MLIFFGERACARINEKAHCLYEFWVELWGVKVGKVEQWVRTDLVRGDAETSVVVLGMP